jgi:hypothetical protein
MHPQCIRWQQEDGQMSDPEIAALIEQAARNLHTLELIALRERAENPMPIPVLWQRLHNLKLAYVRETDALTRRVLKGACQRPSIIQKLQR